MALIALFAPMARSTPTIAIIGCQLQNVTAFRPISALPTPDGRRRQETQTSLTAEPLDLDHQHEIIRRINQERDHAPAVRAEMHGIRGLRPPSSPSAPIAPRGLTPGRLRPSLG